MNNLPEVIYIGVLLLGALVCFLLAVATWRRR